MYGTSLSGSWSMQYPINGPTSWTTDDDDDDVLFLGACCQGGTSNYMLMNAKGPFLVREVTT